MSPTLSKKPENRKEFAGGCATSNVVEVNVRE